MKIANLLDRVKEMMNIKNDAALAVALVVTPGYISRVRKGSVAFGQTAIINIHLLTGIPVRELVDIAAHDAEVRELVMA